MATRPETALAPRIMAATAMVALATTLVAAMVPGRTRAARAALEGNQTMQTVIPVSNQKGGVAKTTTTVSLGAAMVERGLEVLAVDLDPQANLSRSLGEKTSSLRRGVADVLLGNLSVISVSRETSIAGLDVLPANNDMHLVEKFLTVRQNYEYSLRTALERAATYDVVICDCPPSIGALPYTAMTAANLLLIPTQCEYFSTHGLAEVLDMVARESRLGTLPTPRSWTPQVLSRLPSQPGQTPLPPAPASETPLRPPVEAEHPAKPASVPPG
jgi:cellulose biosynthesis protein BcsQ